MKTLKISLLAASILVLMQAANVTAEPLNPAHVPADAKWVVHLDFDAMADTTLAAKVQERHPEFVKGVSQWFEKKYGMNPGKDLRGVTMFSNTYESHTGSLILLANYDLAKVTSRLRENENVDIENHQGHTLFTLHKKQSSDKDSKQAGRAVTIVLLDGKKAVAASSSERAKAALQLLAGEADSLEDKKSELTAKVPTGAVVYGAAINLKEISRHDGVFPILSQHESIVYATGEHDGQVFEEVKAVAGNEEVARNMKATLDGMVALLKVWAADSEAIKTVANDVETALDGTTVTSKYRGDTESVMEALKEVKERAKQWHRASQD